METYLTPKNTWAYKSSHKSFFVPRGCVGRSMWSALWAASKSLMNEKGSAVLSLAVAEVTAGGGWSARRLFSSNLPSRSSNPVYKKRQNNNIK